MAVSPKIPWNWRKRFVQFGHEINFWKLVERIFVFYGTQKGYGGLVGEVGHLDSDLTRKELLGQMIDEKRTQAIRRGQISLVRQLLLEDKCKRAGVSKTEFAKLRVSPKWEEDFYQSMLHDKIFNPSEHVDRRTAKHLQALLKKFEWDFRIRDLFRASKTELRERLVKGIPNSSQREANLLWDSAARLRPSLAGTKTPALPKSTRRKPTKRPYTSK